MRHHAWAEREDADIWVAGRPNSGPIRVVEYDPHWPEHNDVDLTEVDAADETAYGPALEAVGFRLVVRERHWHEHRMFTGDDPRTNLHVFSPDCPEVIRHPMFRDWLRDHPDDLALYRDTKVEAAAAASAAGDDVMDYNQRKEPIIRDIYDRMFLSHGLRGTPSDRRP